MAIVHLIRTEVSIQSEQTQEVILIKLERVSKHRNIIQQRKDAKKLLNYCDAFESEGPGRAETDSGTEAERLNLCVHVRVLIQ